LQAAKSLTQQGLFEPAIAEIMGALLAIQLSCELGLLQICLEGDAKVVVYGINSIETDWSKKGHRMDDLRIGLKIFPDWKMVFARREMNQATHTLARLATTNNMDRLWIVDPPNCIQEVITSKMANLPIC
jgi:ribonuclease HI